MLNVKQKGLSPIGILWNVCVFAFAVTVGLKLVEHYMDFYTIRAAFTELAENPESKDASLTS
jgi:hypothetical protein